VLVVNDGSTDSSGEILKKFGEAIEVITIPKPTGNKSYVQEIGLKSITGDIFIASDGDTVLDSNFVKLVEDDFTTNPELSAVSGYVRSVKHNWITSCRSLEYAVGQNLHKLAQHHIGFLFVIPGAAAVFRTQDFKQRIPFEHDTLTEDLDFTYRLHNLDLKIMYDRRLIVYTQDPATLHSYIHQVRRWFAGGWQCLLKHHHLAFEQPKVAFELSIMYAEGLIFAIIFFIIPFLSIRFYAYFILSYFALVFIFACFSAWKEKRWELILVSVPYCFLAYVNSYIFIEQMIKEVFLGNKNLVWFHPERFVSHR
jgi:biofilm PGA synthesis N-glycosyltransferase PgaC